MSRLIDRILAGNLHVPQWVHVPPEIAARSSKYYQGQLLDCQLIVIDNVAQFLFAGTDQEEWDEKKDFPCLAPPFKTFFMEYVRPSRIISKATGVHPNSGMAKYNGILFRVTELSESREHMTNLNGYELDRLSREIEMAFETLGPRVEANIAQFGDIQKAWPHLSSQERTLVGKMMGVHQIERGIVPEIPEAIRWLITAVSFAEINGVVYGPLAKWDYSLDKTGNIYGDMAFGTVAADPSLGGQGHLSENQSGVFNPAIFPAFLALSLMHCKNVKLISKVPDVKLSKAYQKRHGKPLLKYYTLEIEPMKQVLRTEGRSEEVGLKRALHICRGHFKDYRERGLFGKKKGIFWWDSHVRGHLSEGAILKDYAIKV